MAYEIPGFMVGVLPAENSLIAAQFKAVDVIAARSIDGTDGAAIDVPAASGNPSIGILQNAPIQGEAGTVMHSGISKAIMQGSGSIGDLLASFPGGKLGTGVSTNFAIAQALEDFSDGDVIAVLLVRNGMI